MQQPRLKLCDVAASGFHSERIDRHKTCCRCNGYPPFDDNVLFVDEHAAGRVADIVPNGKLRNGISVLKGMFFQHSVNQADPSAHARIDNRIQHQASCFQSYVWQRTEFTSRLVDNLRFMDITCKKRTGRRLVALPYRAASHGSNILVQNRCPRYAGEHLYHSLLRRYVVDRAKSKQRLDCSDRVAIRDWEDEGGQ